MITHHRVDGYENLMKLMSILDCKGNVILFFCGSPNPLGDSWNRDCNKSSPIVHNVLKQCEKKNFHFVHVGVGTQKEWKDPDCPFKKNEKIMLKNLPTLLHWRHTARLTGEECSFAENVKLMIESLN